MAHLGRLSAGLLLAFACLSAALPGQTLAEGQPSAADASQASVHPWSGWWWPSLSSSAGPHLFDRDGPLARYDAYVRATTGADPNDPARTHVQMTLWAGDYHVNDNFVGLKTWPDGRLKTYSYVIYGDRPHPSGGDWEGDSVSGAYAHPQNLWYPDTRPETRNMFGALTSPNLSYEAIQAILKG